VSSAGDRVRFADPESIRRALDAGDPMARLLVCEGERSKSVELLVERARARGIEVATESAREMRRMSQTPDAPEVLAMGGEPPTRDLDELMRRPGLVLVLVDLRYPANVGFILRSAEVAGAAGVVVAGAWQGEEWDEARRVSMRADRFLSIVATDAQRACDAARASGRRLVALETQGS
jgi:tRNA G18 (ribose-2'-O)-methylase SpoU